MGCGAFVSSADVEGAFDCIKHNDVERALLQRGVRPESVCSCKEYISNYRKLATKTVYLQHEQQHER